jgi:glucose/arabinose dehydrogenase
MNYRTPGLLFLPLLLASRALTMAAIDWPVLAWETTASGLDRPTSLTHAADGSGRVFLTEQAGAVRIIRGTNLLVTPLLTITNRVFDRGEAGLIGLAFPPGFASSRHLYVEYTRKPDVATTISRFSLSSTNDDVADPATEEMILTIPQPALDRRHFGGKLAFGPDGFLYAFIGDGGDFPFQGVAQDPQLLLGKVLRLDTEGADAGYGIPASNPFVGNAAYRPEIWALGLRNPWGASFDRLTGDLYIPDVGEIREEEVNFQPASSRGGENYGWPMMEGNNERQLPATITPESFTRPAFTYRGGAGPAIVGGGIYRGTNFARMQGFYFFGDFGVPGMWAIHRNQNNAWEGATVMSVSRIISQPTCSGLGEDESGEMYMLDYRGSVLHLVDTRRCHPPVAGWTNVAFGTALPVTNLTPGCRIHYTSQNREPTAVDPFVLPGQTIPVTTGTTYQLKAFRDDLQPSLTVTSAFSSLQVATPVIRAVKESTGLFLAATCATPGAVIRYTTNGSPPDLGSALYHGPIPASLEGPVLFAGFANGYAPSEAGFSANPVILSQRLLTNRVELTVWFLGTTRSEMQDSSDLLGWHSFMDWSSGWITNATFSYPYHPTNVGAFRFFRTAPQKPRGPPGSEE